MFVDPEAALKKVSSSVFRDTREDRSEQLVVRDSSGRTQLLSEFVQNLETLKERRREKGLPLADLKLLRYELEPPPDQIQMASKGGTNLDTIERRRDPGLSCPQYKGAWPQD